MVKIIQRLVPESKYSIKCPYTMKPMGITVHNTANDASAENEIAYMTRNNYETSFHFAVDDIQAVQGLPLDRNGWHASDGNGPGNRTTIAIEICYSKSGGPKFDKAEENAAELIAKLLKEYGWGIDKVKRHYDYARDKKYCPHRTMDRGWNRFLNMVKTKLNQNNNNIDIYYAVKTKEDGWLPEVKNLDDYAGWKNHAIIGLKMRVNKGSIKYRVTTASGKQLGWVTGCNINDYNNGWAGNNSPIALVEAEYYTPKDIIDNSGYKFLNYSVNNYPYQIDLQKGKGMDGYAGSRGVIATKFKAFIK